MTGNKLIVNAPLNGLSLGQVSFNLLRELYKRKLQVALFPKGGNVDVSAYQIDPQFGQWLKHSIESRLTKFSRDTPTLNLWHINGSESKLSDRQYTFTFHETDSPTETEVNIVNQQDATFFSSSWSVNNFQTYGAQNVSFIPLGLDEDFTLIPHRLVPQDITHWGLVGKFEGRKSTELIIQSWIKRYGGNRAHALTLCVTNPFFKPEQMDAVYNRVFQGKPKPFNVNVLPHLKTNIEMNQLYNSLDVDLSGLSGAEGWGLPAFTAAALGKWSIVTDCSAHKDWATAENSVLVTPTEMRPVYDGVFFVEGQPFSQGNIYKVTAEMIDEGFTAAEKVAKTPNLAGRKLASEFTYAKTVEQILTKIS